MERERIRIKVCGMRHSENIGTVADIGPDYMGFIFYNKSPRFINNLDVEILNQLSSKIHKVGVFVNEDPSRVLDIAGKYNLDLIQLHGDENVEYCEKIRNAGFKVIKAISVKDPDDISSSRLYQGHIDYFLFDTRGENYGGTGKKFDWSIYDLDIPYFLSGGIHLKDVKTVLSLSDKRLFAIDINSGFETAPGLKNVELVKEAVSLIKEKVYE